jgi:hypothetical protein
VLKNQKIYLIEEIWPKPAHLRKLFGNDDGVENPDLKRLKDILRDDRLLRLLNINPN